MQFLTESPALTACYPQPLQNPKNYSILKYDAQEQSCIRWLPPIPNKLRPLS